MSAGESARVARLAAIFSKEIDGVLVGIGDDAAVLAPCPERMVWTIDEQVEGSHFLLDLMSLEDVGFRATMASASDLAAMGARPIAALASIVAPKSYSVDSFEAIAMGQRSAVDALGSALVGGNLAAGPALSVATTWLGRAARPVGRGGARLGDGLYLAGDVGLAAAGFDALRRGVAVPEAALSAWRRPVARLDAGARMAPVAHAAIDVSDGLAGDAGHVAQASGVALEIDAESLLAACPAALFAAARALDRDALDLALFGGEDYALLCASPEPIEGFARIGEVAAGSGVRLRQGATTRPLAGGFDHFG